MLKQIWYNLFAIVIVFGIIGCATVSYPPPTIQGNKYTNHKYQYTVDIPDGWTAYQEVPKDLAATIAPKYLKMTNLVLVSRETKGYIILGGELDNRKIYGYLNVPDAKWAELPSKMKEDAEKFAHVSDFEYEVKGNNIAISRLNRNNNPHSFKALPLVKAELELSLTMGKAMVGTEYFIYPCHSNNSCHTILIVTSEKDRFDMNRSVFNSVIESLTMHDISTE
jgi:hypothetical protein